MTRLEFGRATEARFLLDAHRRGYLVSRPFDSAPGYDAVVDTGSRLVRVQIKGVRPVQGNMARRSRFPVYSVAVNPHDRVGTADFDVLAIWLDDDARWIFLPRSIRTKRHLTIYTHGRHARRGWEIFRTATLGSRR